MAEKPVLKPATAIGVVRDVPIDAIRVRRIRMQLRGVVNVVVPDLIEIVILQDRPDTRILAGPSTSSASRGTPPPGIDAAKIFPPAWHNVFPRGGGLASINSAAESVKNVSSESY